MSLADQLRNPRLRDALAEVEQMAAERGQELEVEDGLLKLGPFYVGPNADGIGFLKGAMEQGDREAAERERIISEYAHETSSAGGWLSRLFGR